MTGNQLLELLSAIDTIEEILSKSNGALQVVVGCDFVGGKQIQLSSELFLKMFANVYDESSVIDIGDGYREIFVESHSGCRIFAVVGGCDEQ